MATRYFIFDCQLNPVGNPKGYATYIGAEHQAEARGSKVKSALYAAFQAYREKNPNHCLIYKIQSREV